jgi:hypothetical protein
MVLLVIAAVLMWRHWRHWRHGPAARIVTITAVVFALLAVGPSVRFDGKQTAIPGPWRLLSWFPLLKYMYPARVVFIVIACVAVLLALACDTLPKLPDGGSPVRLRTAWYLLVAVALVPIVPKPMPGKGEPHVPAFIADGMWRRYVDADHTLVAIPIGNSSLGLRAVYWQTVAGQEYKVPGGHFLGPDPHGVGMFGAPARPTTFLIYQLDHTGTAPAVTDQAKRDAVTDLRYWRAAVVVLDPAERYGLKKWEIVTTLTGITPILVGGVWVWDVRPLVG